MEENIERYIEALFFASDQPVTILELQECINKVFGPKQEEATKSKHPKQAGQLVAKEHIETVGEPTFSITEAEVFAIVETIIIKYITDQYSFELRKIGGGYQFLTKAPYHEAISVLLNLKEKKRLSSAALETLSIIAYKQPITKSEIEQIRGVNADYSIHKLLEKDLIEIAGKKDTPGNPILYEVSQTFLEYFGINSTSDLPQPKEVEPITDNVVGEHTENKN